LSGRKPKKEAESYELTVFISGRDSTCGECGSNLGTGAWITLVGEKGAACLSCSDLAHLVYLPAGDAALTRRARKHSTLSAVVLKWSRSRKRYERQGLLVEEAGLEKAEEECLADADIRGRRREREAEKREQLDLTYVTRFAAQIRRLFPGCPRGREVAIAEHACQKYSGRVGRSAAAKDFDEQAVRLAVGAHIRHVETDYDELLSKGFDRHDARSIVGPVVSAVLENWAHPNARW
jgi:hypothetical protein